MTRTTLNGRISLSTLAVILAILSVTTVSAQAQPRVAVAPLLNTSDDPGSDALAATVSRAIGVNLDLLGGYEVQRLGQPLLNTTPAALDTLAERGRYDNVVFGTIARPDARTTVFRVALYDRGEGAVTYDNSWTITSIFEVFDTADLVVEAMLDQFSEERIAFGQLAISNTGTRGEYHVYVNDNLLGDNLTQSRILAGTHSVRVEQTRMFGRYVVMEERVRIPDGGSGRLEFAIPELTDQEEERLTAFRSRLTTATGTDKQRVDFRTIVSDYIGIARDLEEADYSAAIPRYQREIEEEFNEFVAWYSEPTVVVEEVEVERGPDGETRPVGPGRPVAAPGSGGVLFRYSQPIDSDG